jgi:hypothetical protein
VRLWPVVLLIVMALGGCSGKNGQPPLTADEEKAVKEVQNLTPEQQIERAQNSPMPQSAKDALIKSIKDKNGLK